MFNSKNTYPLKWIHKIEHKIYYNHDKGTKLEFFDKHTVSIVSFVSARKLKCPSSAQLKTFRARLGTFTARLSSSQKIPAWTHHYESPPPNFKRRLWKAPQLPYCGSCNFESCNAIPFHAVQKNKVFTILEFLNEWKRKKEILPLDKVKLF